MSGLTKGPLASEVYWRRRLLVLALALLLVLGLSRLLGGGSDATDSGSAGGTAPAGQAAQAGADTTDTPAVPGATDGATATPPTPTPSTKKQLRQARRAEKKAAEQAASAAAEASAAAASAAAVAALPDPQGVCADTDVVATSSVPSPVGGSDVAIDVSLRTAFSPACTWKVSADTLAVKITSGQEDIWSSQQCPQAVPTQDVVLRRAVPTTVQVVWSARRSDDTCSGRTSYALPGFYHVYAAALAGEPSDEQFELVAPAAPVVTKTADPEGGKKKGKNKQG